MEKVSNPEKTNKQKTSTLVFRSRSKYGRKRSKFKTYQLIKFVVHIYWRLFLVSIFNLNKTNYPTIHKHLITRDINNFTLFTSKENASADKSVSYSFKNIFQNWVSNRLAISYRRTVKSIIIQSALPIALNFQWQGENFGEKSLKFIVFWDFYLLGENSDIIIEAFCGCQFARSVVTRRVWGQLAFVEDLLEKGENRMPK